MTLAELVEKADEALLLFGVDAPVKIVFDGQELAIADAQIAVESGDGLGDLNVFLLTLEEL